MNKEDKIERIIELLQEITGDAGTVRAVPDHECVSSAGTQQT